MTTLQSSRSALDSQPSFGPINSQLGPWRLVRLLGEGQFCQVFQATPVDATSGSSADYAVKVLRPHYAENPTAIAMLRREAFIGGQISHPHLTCVLSAHLDIGRRFLVMPFQPGVTVSELLRARSTVDVTLALWFSRQTAEALVALHATGWLHGDVKPDNMLVANNGHVTLCDLGFVRKVSTVTGDHHDTVSGTPAYLAPELLINTQPATGACDIYSLGVTLFELLTGRLPFAQETASELGAAHRLLPAPDPRSLCLHLSASVSRLVRQMLAKEPLRRPTASELVQRLVDLEIDELTNSVAE